MLHHTQVNHFPQKSFKYEENVELIISRWEADFQEGCSEYKNLLGCENMSPEGITQNHTDEGEEKKKKKPKVVFHKK